MCSGVVTAHNGMFDHLHAVQGGVKINTDAWNEVLSSFVVPALCNVYGDTPWVLILDNAPSHGSKKALVVMYLGARSVLDF